MNGVWNFPKNNWGQRQGISESGIELFKGKPIQSLAREICQNSLDAGIKNKKVIIEFSVFETEAHSFPGRNDFLNALNLSKDTWKHQKSRKTLDFLENAFHIFDNNTIRCLRISDYNTSGVKGSSMLKNSDWEDLIKASGSSDKNSTAGGSFGIGKFAPFACSELRTVFYSTFDIENVKSTQGVARLVSFIKDEQSGEESMGIGYFGNPDKNRPLNDLINLDKNHFRNSTGTDIYIYGFIDVEDWVIDIIDQVLDGFLYAIFKETLEVKVGDEIINKSTLANTINKYRDKLSNSTKSYYQVLTSENSKWSNHNFKNMGNIMIGLLYGEDWFPRSVSMIRNPWMKIYDQKNISNSIPFSGVCIIEGDKLNEYLRKLENPQHTAWEEERLEKKTEINTAKIVLQDLRKLIKKEFENYLKDDGLEQIDIEGAGDLIPFEDETKKPNPNQVDPFVNRIQEVKIKKNDNDSIKSNSDNELNQEEVLELMNSGVIESDEDFNLFQEIGLPVKEGINKNNNGVEIEDENKNNTTFKIKKIETLELKLMCIDFKKSMYRIAIISAKNYSNCKFYINELDDQGNSREIKIIAVNGDNVSFRKNEIYNFTLEQRNLKTIDFSVNTKNYFSAEVTLYGFEE